MIFFKYLLYPLNILVIFLIRIYQRASINKKSKCLFYPSCSNYSILAFKKYNFIKAMGLTIFRLRDCNPFSIKSYIDYP